MEGGLGTTLQMLYSWWRQPLESNKATEEWSFPSAAILTEGDIFLSGGTTLKGFGKAAGIPCCTWSSGEI